MKSLFLIRHAKSSWDYSELSDFERPLNKRGKHDAPLMASILALKGIVPDHMISSGAKRAITTAQIMAKAVNFPASQIEVTNNLFHASANEIIAIAAKANNSHQTLFLIGHNPGMTYAANRISNAKLDNLPTTSIFAVDFDIERWEEIIGLIGQFKFFEYPKRHK